MHTAVIRIRRTDRNENMSVRAYNDGSKGFRFNEKSLILRL